MAASCTLILRLLLLPIHSDFCENLRPGLHFKKELSANFRERAGVMQGRIDTTAADNQRYIDYAIRRGEVQRKRVETKEGAISKFIMCSAKD